MPQVSSLSENLALDPNDQLAIQRQKKKVDKEATEMQMKIVEFIQEKTENYKQNVGKRMQEIEESFEKFIPPISHQEKKAIKQEVKENIEEIKEKLGVSVSDFIWSKHRCRWDPGIK